MSLPIIGLTLDAEIPGGYSKFPWYAIRKNYATAVVRAGGVPFFLPHEATVIAEYAGLIDGIIVTGGAFDIDPSLYGAMDRHDTVTTKDQRTEFELGLTRAMLGLDKPVLGICGGEQLLAVALGGSLVQHIPDEIEHPLAHEQSNPRDQPGHLVQIEPDSLLSRMTGSTELAVNSAHHQAVKEPGPNLKINAVASDGVIEGVEDPLRRFCIGVQWHPEFEISPGDRQLFLSFVAACGEARA